MNLLKIVGGIGSAGSTSNTLNNPRGIFVDTTLNLYVADCGNNRIPKFIKNQCSKYTKVFYKYILIKSLMIVIFFSVLISDI